MEERQYTDLAVLEAVEHPADMEVLMTPEGMPILFASPQLPAEAVTDQGTNCEAVMVARDHDRLTIGPLIRHRLGRQLR